MLGAPPTWSASFVPMAVGYGCVFLLDEKPFTSGSAFWILCSLAAMVLIETGKHAVNDLIDFRTGNDLAVDEEHRTPFSGGKKVLTAGILSEGEAVLTALGTMGAAAVLGLLIVWQQSPVILWIGIAGMIIGTIYTLPPWKLCYRGLGEAAVGVTYGPLIVLGAYLTFSAEDLLIPLVLSLHTGCLIVNVLVINEYPDYEADMAAGKRNVLVRKGKRKALRWYSGLFAAAYIPIVVLAVYTREPAWLITLGLCPLMAAAYRNCRDHYDQISRLIRSNDLTIKIHMLSGLLLLAAMVLIRIW